MNPRFISLFILMALLAACGGQAILEAHSEQAVVETPTITDTEPVVSEAELTIAPVIAEAATESFPVTIEHKYGQTEIARLPERIVTVGLTEQDVLLALGIVPVGTTEWFGEYPGAIWPWAQDKLGDTPVPELVGDASTINFEKVAALKPDLILALYAGLTQEQYDLLTQIAPTVAQPGDYVDYGIPWQELTRTVGRAVGQAEEADQLVTEVETRFEQVRAEHPEFAGATSIVATPYEGIWVYGSEDVRGRFLTALGFKLPEGLAEITGEEFGGNLSFERADLLDVDVIIWLDSDEAQGPLGGPVYQNLAVHTEGREVFLDSYDDPLGGATSFVSVLSLPFLLDGLVPKLAAALDKLPAAEPDLAAALDCADGFRPFDHELLASEPLCLPIAPQRIVALDIASLELALLIGKPPVLTSDWMLQEMPLLLPQYAGALADIEQVGYPAELEKILLLKPDIILAPEDTIDVEQARAIAPLVAPEQVIYDDWKLGMQFWSEVLNVPDFYAEMEANYNTRVAELRAALGQPDKLEVSVISASTYGLYLWMPDSPPGAILADVGLARPEAQSLVGDAAITRYGEKQYIEISEERLDLADGDALFYFTYASTDPKIAGEESNFIKTIEQKPLWQTLNAVKTGKAFFVPGYWWRSQSYLLANKVLDDLFAHLTDTSATTPVLAGQE
jgi:iron complex transport system substrate-binding protein